MNKSLIVVFLILYFGNSYMCAYFYPDYLVDREAWEQWYYLRCRLYELMFLVILIKGFFKRDIWTKSLLIFAVTIVSASLLDKIQGIHEYHAHDILLIMGAIWASITVYKQWKKREKEKDLI